MKKRYIVFFIFILLSNLIITPSQPDLFPQEKEAKKKKKKKRIDLKWLKISKSNLKHWKMDKERIEEGFLKFSPKWSEKKKTKVYKVVGILSKKSGSYKLATNKLLEIFYLEKIRAEITIYNFAKNKERKTFAINLAEELNADLIFSMGSETADLMTKKYKGGRIPVVASICKDPVGMEWIKKEEAKTGSKTNIAYTSLNIPLNIILDYLKRLKPNLKVITLMYNKNHKQVMKVEVRPTKKELEKLGYHVFDVAVESREKSKEQLAEQMPKALEQMRQIDPELKNSIFWVTSSTAVFSQIGTVNEYAENVPVLGSIPNVVSKGDKSAVLAIGIDRRNNAHVASLYAVRILRGEIKAGDLPVGLVTPPDIAINFKIAKKNDLKIPFSFFESASFIYDYNGKAVRTFGKQVKEDLKKIQ